MRNDLMSAAGWLHTNYGTLQEIADEVGIERGAGAEEIAEKARREVKRAAKEDVELDQDEVETSLGCLWKWIGDRELRGAARESPDEDGGDS